MDGNVIDFEDIFHAAPNLLELSDGNLQTDDGYSFRIHRCLLAKSSNYFSALFRSDRNGRSDVLIPGIGGEVLNNVLIYIYTHSLHINETNLCDLLLAADYLLLDELITDIRKQLPSLLSVSNCISLLIVATQISDSSILPESYRYSQTHFEAIVLNEDSKLSDLPLEILKQFLSDRDLSVRDESAVWSAIVRWIQADYNRRESLVPDLLMHLAICDIEESLAARILEHAIVAENPFCKEINQMKIANACDDNFRILHHYIENHSLPLCNTRKLTHLNFIADYCVQNNTENLKIYITYDENIDLWRKIIDIDMCPDFLEFLGSCIYTFKTNENGNFCYNLIDRQWTELASLRLLREYYYVVKLEGFIYVIGGVSLFSDEATNEVERYDPERKEWNFISPMLPVRSFVAVSLGCNIYAIGNTLGLEMLAQVYVPEYDTWMPLPPPMIFRYNFAVVAYHERIFILGGTNEGEYLTDVEVFDPQQDRWIVEEQLPYSYYVPKAIVLNGNLIVYDNHLEDRACRKTNPVVQWNDELHIWIQIDLSSPLNKLYKYCIFSLDEPECLNCILRENRDPRTNFLRTPFY